MADENIVNGKIVTFYSYKGGTGRTMALADVGWILASTGLKVLVIDWTTEARATATGASRNIPGFVGAIPFVGYVLGPYGFIHHGKDVTMARSAGSRSSSPGCRR